MKVTGLIWLEDIVRKIAQKHAVQQQEVRAVTQFLSQFQQTRHRVLLQQARGIWQDRTDLPSLETLRREFDRMEP